MPSRVMDLVADRLQTFRREHRLSQEEAANLVGCSIPTYGSMELAAGPQGSLPDPKLSTLMRVVSALGLDQSIVEALVAHAAQTEARPPT